MTAGITIYCDHQYEYGSCPQTIHLRTTDLAEARAAAQHLGWHLGYSDLCQLYHAPKRRPPAPTRPRIDTTWKAAQP